MEQQKLKEARVTARKMNNIRGEGGGEGTCSQIFIRTPSYPHPTLIPITENGTDRQHCWGIQAMSLTIHVHNCPGGLTATPDFPPAV